MKKKLLHRDILLLFMSILLTMLVAVVVVIVQTKSSVKAPSLGRVAIVGEVVCLPHKNTTGPQTLECALGLKDKKGRYYVLSDEKNDYKNISKAFNGAEVNVTGTISTADNDVYSVNGTIEVTDVEILSKD